jgi:thiamine-phosphate pyrophosphorylase
VHRLLAITPPYGAPDPGLVRAWVEGAKGLPLALLLRRPARPANAILADPDLRGLADAAREAGLSLLLSCDAGDAPGLRAAAEHGLGVQLRADPSETALAQARALGVPCVGASMHGAPRTCAADYVCLAPVFAPATAAEHKPPIGLAPLSTWAAVHPAVLALGGVSPATAAACMRAGAYGLASIRTFFGPPSRVVDDVAVLAASIHAVLDESDAARAATGPAQE